MVNPFSYERLTSQGYILPRSFSFFPRMHPSSQDSFFLPRSTSFFPGAFLLSQWHILLPHILLHKHFCSPKGTPFLLYFSLPKGKYSFPKGVSSSPRAYSWSKAFLPFLGHMLFSKSFSPIPNVQVACSSSRVCLPSLEVFLSSQGHIFSQELLYVRKSSSSSLRVSNIYQGHILFPKFVYFFPGVLLPSQGHKANPQVHLSFVTLCDETTASSGLKRRFASTAFHYTLQLIKATERGAVHRIQTYIPGIVILRLTDLAIKVQYFHAESPGKLIYTEW